MQRKHQSQICLTVKTLILKILWKILIWKESLHRRNSNITFMVNLTSRMAFIICRPISTQQWAWSLLAIGKPEMQ